jgi:hypothetical protein
VRFAYPSRLAGTHAQASRTNSRPGILTFAAPFIVPGLAETGEVRAIARVMND